MSRATDTGEYELRHVLGLQALALGLLIAGGVGCSSSGASGSGGTTTHGATTSSGATTGSTTSATSSSTGMVDPWSCLGMTTYMTPPATIHGTYTIVEAGSMMPVPTATVKLCQASDTLCATPIDSQMSDAQGNVTLTIDTTKAKNGFIEVSATGILTTLHYVHTHLPAADFTGGTITTLSPAALSAYATAVGATVDPTQGQLGISLAACPLSMASGATVSFAGANASSVTFYVVDQPAGASKTASRPTEMASLACSMCRPRRPRTSPPRTPYPARPSNRSPCKSAQAL